MGKYQILVNILDRMRSEAPLKYGRYFPDPMDSEKLDQARARIFIHLFLKVRYGIADFEEREKYITDGPYDGGIDAYYINREEKKIVFLQSKFRGNQKNFETKRIFVEEILHMEIDRILEGECEDEGGNFYNGKILRMIKNIHGIEDIGRYHYEVILLANLDEAHYKKSQIRKLAGGFPVQVFNYEKCYNELVFPMVTGCFFHADEIRIRLSLINKENSEGRIGNTIETSYGACKSTVAFVPVLEIAKIMAKYKNAVLKYNPRCFLSLDDNKINPKIAATIRQKKTNEIALYNNGITILSDDTSFSSRVARKDIAQLIIRNPQIINGGQTAYTLSEIYENDARYQEYFQGKEILVRIITFLGEYKEEDKLKLIEELSRATNEQTAVKEADRRANEKVQIKYQKQIYEEFGLFYNRKKGEFYDGLQQEFITKDRVIDRTVFMRVATAIQGDVSAARKAGEEILFRQEHFEKVFEDSRIYRKYIYGYFCHRYLTKLEKLFSRKKGTKYGTDLYGHALRFGKYAVTYVAAESFREDLDVREYESYACLCTDCVLKQWKDFEKSAAKKKRNREYFYVSVGENGEIENYYNYDGYYKGKTINRDLRIYKFYKEIEAEKKSP